MDPRNCACKGHRKPELRFWCPPQARTAFENEEPGIVQVADGKWAEMESERAQKKGCFSCF